MDARQKLICYLAAQFPSTVGHKPLEALVNDVWLQGVKDAQTVLALVVEQCQSRQDNTTVEIVQHRITTTTNLIDITSSLG